MLGFSLDSISDILGKNFKIWVFAQILPKKKSLGPSDPHLTLLRGEDNALPIDPHTKKYIVCALKQLTLLEEATLLKIYTYTIDNDRHRQTIKNSGHSLLTMKKE